MPDPPEPRTEDMSREALQAEVERLRWLLDANPQVPWSADAEGNITDFSQRWLDLTGLTREQAVGGGWVAAPHPDDVPRMVEAWTRSVATGEPYDVRHRIRVADGSHRWMRSWAVPRRAESGEVLAWFGSTEDVHEATSESRRLYATADALPAMMFHVDRGLVYRFCNRRVEETFGRPRSQILGRTVREIVGEATFQAVLPYLERALAGETVEWAMWVAFPTGRRFTRATYVPSRGPDGEVVGIDVLAGDDTKARVVEEALRESESQHRQIAEGIPQIVWTTRPDGYHDFFNERWYEYTGMERGGERGWDWKDYLHPDDYPRTLAVWTQCLETGSPYEIEYRFKGRDGAYRWFLGQALAIRNDDGTIARWFGTLTDVHDQKEAEEALRRTGETFERLVQGSPFGIYVVDADFRLALVSQGAQKVFENVRPLIGRDFAEVLRAIWEEPFGSQAIGVFRNTLVTGEPFHSPRTVESRSDVGEVESYDWRVERIAMPDGRHAAVCHFYDLSERLRYEAAVHESESRLRLALDTARLGTWDHDVQTGVTSYSDAVGPMFGRPREPLSLSPEELLRYVHEGDRTVVAHAINANLERGEPYAVRIRVVGDDGATRWVESKGELERDAEGRPLRVRGVAVDVTEQEKAEKALREANERLERAVAERTQELVRANRDLDQFAYSVAHDLRAPLRSIVSSSRMLAEDAGERLSDEERATLDRQVASALRLAKIVDDLLGFARLADAQPRKEAFDMTALARRVAGEVVAQRSGCVVQVQDGMGAQGDPSLVGYVLTNLLDNACKFSPRGSAVRVGEAEGAFFVRDRGMGFDMAHAHKLFVAFERLVGQEIEGTGVGLANVRRIVEKHGGRVWGESEPGKGATFWFTLG